jgi:hypothetical protein
MAPTEAARFLPKFVRYETQTAENAAFWVMAAVAGPRVSRLGKPWWLSCQEMKGRPVKEC